MLLPGYERVPALLREKRRIPGENDLGASPLPVKFRSLFGTGVLDPVALLGGHASDLDDVSTPQTEDELDRWWAVLDSNQ